MAEIRAMVDPKQATSSLLDSSLPEHVAYTLQEAGLTTLSELVVQIKLNPDDVMKLQGIGPRAMAEINRLVDGAFLTPVVEERSG